MKDDKDLKQKENHNYEDKKIEQKDLIIDKLDDYISFKQWNQKLRDDWKNWKSLPLIPKFFKGIALIFRFIWNCITYLFWEIIF